MKRFRFRNMGQKKSSQSIASYNPYAQEGDNDQAGPPMTGYDFGSQSQTSNCSYGVSQSTEYWPDRYGTGGRDGSSGTHSDYRLGGYGGFGSGNESVDHRYETSAGTQEKQHPNPGVCTYYEIDANDNDYQAIIHQKQKIQRESASSVHRSVQIARQATDSGQKILTRLGAQGKSLQGVDQNLDLASSQNEIAQERAIELKRLNGSMLAIHVNNPFTSKRRRQKEDDEVLNRHATKGEDVSSDVHHIEFPIKHSTALSRPRLQPCKKDYGRFNLDDEGDDIDEIEDDIDDGLNVLEGQVSIMYTVAKLIDKKIDGQTATMKTIMSKTSAVDSATRANTERLACIK